MGGVNARLFVKALATGGKFRRTNKNRTQPLGKKPGCRESDESVWTPDDAEAAIFKCLSR
jgi:hypothetical protein